MCLTDSLHRYRLKVVAEAGGQDGRTLTQNLALLHTCPHRFSDLAPSSQAMEIWKTLDLHKAQVRISSRGPVFSEPFFTRHGIFILQKRKKKLKRSDSAGPVEQF